MPLVSDVGLILTCRNLSVDSQARPMEYKAAQEAHEVLNHQKTQLKSNKEPLKMLEFSS